MQYYHSINEIDSIAKNLNLKFFEVLSEQDKKRFAQCFNCVNLCSCVTDEKEEDENGMCKLYKELPHHK